MWAAVGRETLSHLSGTASLIVWIFAQSPVDGLSAVFLLQWTAGDLTNLVGSILTHQLPMQIVIAAYMLSVDLCLCAQFWAYGKPSAKPSHDRDSFVSERTPLLVAKYRRGGRHSLRSNSRATRSSRHHAPVVAYRPQSKRARSSDAWVVRGLNGHRSHSTPHFKEDRAQSQSSRRPSAQQDESFWPSDMESSTTESLARGRRRERLALPVEEPGSLAGSMVGPGSDDESGRALAPAPHLQRKRLLAPNPSTTRRGSAMVLLGVYGLFAFGPFRSNLVETGGGETTVLSTAPVTSLSNASVSELGMLEDSWRTQDTIHIASPRHPVLLYMPEVATMHNHRSRRRRPRLSFSQLVGRISAWVCTLLYMTSRLPQIWTNFQRRSVKGLSLLLFVSAFFANLLYSVSILSNPKAVGPQREAFLMESLPFLLGACGTLVFDLVIIVQWYMWHTPTQTTQVAA